MEKINRRNTTPTSSSAVDDALQALVRLLAQQAARDGMGGSGKPVDQAQYEEVIHDQA